MTEPPAVAVPRLTLVKMPACHFCDEAHTILERLSRQGRISLDVADAASPEGSTLLARHRPGMFPLVLIDGEFLSAGRLPRRRLAKVLGVVGAAL